MTQFDTPLASFESKWGAVHPELPLALKFVAPGQRRAQAAFACLVFELESAAFAAGEAEPAIMKLQWWGDELARAARHEARHPLTRELARHPAFSTVPLAGWYAAIGGALAQRDAQPAADRAAQLELHAGLYRPLAEIEVALFASLDVAAVTRVRSLACALRETATLRDALRNGRLPVPLDLLARHRLARADLSRPSPQQGALLRDWISGLASECAHCSRSDSPLGALHAAVASACRWRARKAAGAHEPLVTLNALLARLPLRAAVSAWRGGRRARA